MHLKCGCRARAARRRSRSTRGARLIIARLDRRAFRERVDFISTPGHRARGGSRVELGIPGAGPTRVVTDKAVLAANPESGELELSALYPGVTVDEVRAGIAWELTVRETLEEVAAPSAEELRVLREVVGG